MRGAARLDRAMGRLVGERGEEEGARLLAEVDPAALRERVHALEEAPAELRRLEKELEALRADHAELAGEVEVATMEWLRERQDAETQLQAYRDRARELKVRLNDLEGAGSDAPCPTCGRILHERFGDVVAALREEWESVVQDGSWWKRRREQLDLKPAPLRELEGRSLRLQATVEARAEGVERARSRIRQLRSARERLRELERGDGSSPSGDDFQPGEGDATVEALRAMTGLRSEMVGEARARILELAGRALLRVSGTRLLGMTWREREDSVVLEGVGETLVDPTPEDRAAAVVALRLGVAAALLEEGTDLAGPLVLGASFDRMDEECRLRTVEVLRGLRSRVEQILLVTRGDVAELCPEVFDAVLELGGEGGSR
ncbi:MAG TPA: hypothetical protein VE173_10955, partial [Longimicrobiales bacterium]|nr:hypothetical protein [Longimicrobiales bacterium]